MPEVVQATVYTRLARAWLLISFDIGKIHKVHICSLWADSISLLLAEWNSADAVTAGQRVHIPSAEWRSAA